MAKYDPNDRTRATTDDPSLSHEWLLKELCEVIERREMLPTRLEFYRQSVEAYPLAALKNVLSDIYSQSPMPTKLPSPLELRGMVRKHAPRTETRSSTVEEERWRRQYDVWLRGRFSDEALEVACTLSDEELGVGLEGNEDESYMPCQHPGCIGLIPWPTSRTDAGRTFCQHHQPRYGQGNRLTRAEKVEIARDLTPSARALLRSALPQLMADIPITREEQAITDADAVPLRAKAFERTADGPGVNPSVFLNRPFLSDGMPSDYAERRQMVAAAGWKFQPSKGYWTKGKRVLTDQQVDSFSDHGLLGEFVGQRWNGGRA